MTYFINVTVRIMYIYIYIISNILSVEEWNVNMILDSVQESAHRVRDGPI